MNHRPIVKKLEDGSGGFEHAVCCGDCSEEFGITRTVPTIVATSRSRHWANHLARQHRKNHHT